MQREGGKRYNFRPRLREIKEEPETEPETEEPETETETNTDTDPDPEETPMAAADPEEMEAKLKAVLSKLDALEAEKTGYKNGRLAPRIERFHGKSSEDAKLGFQRF